MDGIRRAELLRYLVLAAQREGTRLFAARLKKLGTTPSQAEMLRVIQESDAISVKQLGERLICEGGNPSRLVAALIKRGLAEAAPAKSDRRMLAINLTAKGYELAEQIKIEEEAFYDEIERYSNSVDSLEDQLLFIIRGTRSARALNLRGILTL